MNYTQTIKQFERNPDKKGAVRLNDMLNSYKRPIKSQDNPIIYKTFVKSFSPMQLGLTVINSGAINKEFYMTRGHIHKKPTPEFYILLEGSGLLLIQKGKPKIIKLKKGEIALIPENYAHRLINTGNKKLKVLTIYHEDSQPNYKVKFKKRFFKK